MQVKAVRLAKQILVTLGVAYFKLPYLTTPGGKPWAFVLTHFLGSTVVSVGRFVWISGALRATSPLGQIWPQKSRWSPKSAEQNDYFVLSSFLNALVPDEAWTTATVSSSHLQENDYVILGKGSRLVDGSAFRAHNYFHFLLQAVPAWVLLEKDQALILKVRGIKDWHQSVCEALTIPLKPVAQGELLSPSSTLHHTKGLDPTKIAVAALRKQVRTSIGGPIHSLGGVENSPHQPLRVLLINRTPSTSRHADRIISNLEEVDEVLRAVFEVKIEDFANKSFREQFDLVNWAHVVCGPHGAGLSNVALNIRGKPPGVVEIVHHLKVPWHFERLCKILGFSFQRVFVSGTGGREMVVDPQELADAIRRSNRQ